MKTLVCLISILSFAKVIGQEPIEGIWNTGKENTKVEIKLEDDQYTGTIMSSDNSKAPLGKLLLKEISTNKPYRGKIFVARQKKWFDAEFTPADDTLTVKIMVGFRSRTVEWKKDSK